MKKIINILFIISNFIFTQQLPNQYWDINNNYSTIIDRIDTNHYFSLLSSSSNGMLSNYGVYGNSTKFTLNNKTQLYSNFNIMKSMESEYTSYINDFGYSMSLGMKYQLNENTSLSAGITIIKPIIEGSNNHTYLP
ncbi:MAG: hypothetical protein CMG25_06430 [Candidatus Marinimicrobia bacterium]|nr:hypothetical protein [Candidatus Neomarinimicrobiota bacterium]|tara:strand:+ start:6002 stop:6409 length:408 start_codon:yes stop_codon:yes gene_type:complete